GLPTRPIVAFAAATSSAVELRPYCAAIHWYPSARRGVISLLKHDPSAQRPWQNTMLFFVLAIFVSFAFSFDTLVYLGNWANVGERPTSNVEFGGTAHGPCHISSSVLPLVSRTPK